MKTSMYLGVSLDGFIAKPDGNLDWLVKFQNDEAGRNYEAFISTIDAIVIGRGTFETILAYPTWPYDKKVFILSKSLTQLPDKTKATLLSLKPAEVLRKLSGEGIESVYVDGGKTIQGFLRDDCIDEMIITRVPVLLGSGIPLFGRLDRNLSFKHVETRVFSNGLVQSQYIRTRT